MENTQNRNDIYNFFKDMPEHFQQEAINKIQQQINKPPEVSLQPNYKNNVVSATEERK